MLLTQNSTPIFKYVVWVLGEIMNVVYNGLSAIGIQNIGIAIIVFTLVIYALLTPLTIKQQKFSKLQSKMNPEIQAIQNKYKGKNQDQAAMMRMNEETQAVYKKYGVNPMGSCVQLLIQMPILFALYRVIWNIPAYVDKVRAVFDSLSTTLLNTAGSQEVLAEYATQASVNLSKSGYTQNTIIDILYKFKSANWDALAAQYPDMSGQITTVRNQLDHMNNFLGLNIAESPMSILTAALAAGAILTLIGAVLIPVLAAATQYFNTMLMTNNNASAQGAASGAGENAQMMQTMNTMNKVMPLMSAVFCLTLPVGMGIYWIAGAVFRSIQALFINKRIDNMDIDEVVKKNMEKINEKRAKEGLPPQKNIPVAKMNTRNIQNKAVSEEERKASIEKSTDYYKSHSSAKPGSLASKAMMVQQYNDKGDKKK